MGLKDTLADPPRSGCGYAAALADLSADDREAVEAAVADPRWPLFISLRIMWAATDEDCAGNVVERRVGENTPRH